MDLFFLAFLAIRVIPVCCECGFRTPPELFL